MSVLNGTAASDTLVGTYEADTINGYGGNDTIHSLYGSDLAFGGDGNDQITTWGGNDSSYGGDGDDLITTEGERSFSYGGAGNDVLMLSDVLGGSVSRGWGGAGNDVLAITGPNGAVLAGGGGIDTLILRMSSQIIASPDAFIDFSSGSGTATGSDGTLLTFSGFEHLTFNGLNGNDTVIGGSRADVIHLSEGANVASGGDGDDLISVQHRMVQTLDGGTGHDTFLLNGTEVTLTFVVDAAGGVDDGLGSQIIGFEQFSIMAGTGDDFVQLSTSNDTMFGFIGNDTLQGGGGRDVIRGDAGDDVLAGEDGRDWLTGGLGDDLLSGGTGHDVLRGARGTDTLTGGDGADRFVFARDEDSTDLITDFTSGEDWITLAADLLGTIAPPPGTLAPGLLNVGGPVGTGAQFVLSYDAASDTSLLAWHAIGVNTVFVDALIRFAGEISLGQDDLLIL